jgi:hypothetical protein
MTILVVALNPSMITVNEYLFPNSYKDSFIYDHLRYYCSKGQSVPTITIKVCSDSVIVTRGHYYLLIAKELGYEKIQAVVDQNLSRDIESFLNSPYIVQVNWKTLRQNEDQKLLGYVWYVFFFKRNLSQSEQEAFHTLVVNFYEQIEIPGWANEPETRILDLNYSHLGYSAEFQAYVPFADERWYAGALAAAVDFHMKYVPIVSCQGRKFYIAD